MNIWLLRHGEAERLMTTDEQRNLTDHGRQEVFTTAKQLKGKTINIILQSPYVRACQTAEIVKEVIDYRGMVETVDWITPDSNPKQVILKLEQYEGENILMVSHQPLLGYLVGLLMNGNTSCHALNTAELVGLEGEYACVGSMRLKK